jgi:hypothetical protein
MPEGDYLGCNLEIVVVANQRHVVGNPNCFDLSPSGLVELGGLRIEPGVISGLRSPSIFPARDVTVVGVPGHCPFAVGLARKWKSIKRILNLGAHDDEVASTQSLGVAIGDLKKIRQNHDRG